MNTFRKSFIFIALISLFIPALVFAQKKWVKVSAGGRFSAALRSDGTIWECGRARQGQLGNGNDTTPVRSFVLTGTDTDWADVEAGEAHCLAIKRDGSLWAWGNNVNGELGVGDSSDRYFPAQVGSDKDWAYISAASYASFAIKKDGTLWAWGLNQDGNLGDGTVIDRAVPEEIDSAYKWKKVVAGYTFAHALRADGSLWAWGWNDVGQLGNGTFTNSKVPVQVGTDTNWTDISSGYSFTLALKRNGTLWSWGYNYNGQLGQGNVTSLITPKQIFSDSDWANIFTGSIDGFAIKKDGSLWDWGWNGYGGLGNGNTNQVDLPQMIGSAKTWRVVSGGKGYRVNGYVYGLHTLAIQGDSTDICVAGQNDYGQLGNGTTNPVLQFDCSVNSGFPNISSQFNGIKVYPNPAPDFVNVSFGGKGLSNSRMSIFDLNGKQVYSDNIPLSDNGMQINISFLPKGMYMLEIVSNEQVFRTKFVKD